MPIDATRHLHIVQNAPKKVAITFKTTATQPPISPPKLSVIIGANCDNAVSYTHLTLPTIA